MDSRLPACLTGHRSRTGWRHATQRLDEGVSQDPGRATCRDGRPSQTLELDAGEGAPSSFRPAIFRAIPRARGQLLVARTAGAGYQLAFGLALGVWLGAVPGAALGAWDWSGTLIVGSSWTAVAISF